MKKLSSIFLDLLPEATGAVVVISGGLDSTASLRLAVEKYTPDNIVAVSFDYGQKQRHELSLAAKTCHNLGVKHKIIPLDFLNEINQGFSANVDPNIQMPTAEEVEGVSTPQTVVSNRNMIMMSIAAALAEVNGYEVVISGFQQHDHYGYYDCTPAFVSKLNSVLVENPKIKVQIVPPFVNARKHEEIQTILELDGDLSLFENTLTCYNPHKTGDAVLSCGKCPSCGERLAAFADMGLVDPVRYWSES